MTSPANLHPRDMRVVPLRIEPQVHPSIDSKAKRILDIFGAIIGLVITGIVAIPVAIAMQLDNPGSIFYSQVRCGFEGKPFKIWKFRSMIVNADRKQHLVENQAKGQIFKNENDPRITKVGRFLRRTSLDEFPQFWNVLQGDMSLVGTRPPTIEEGRSAVLDFEDIVRMDLNYQKRWSLLYDINLIIRTVAVVLVRKGAC